MERHTVVLAVAFLALAAVAVPGAASADEVREAGDGASLGGSVAPAGDHVEACAAEPPDDFADPEEGNDAVGWVDGYWYNEPLDADEELENPLTDEEVDELVTRTAARVEALRCLTFDEVPPLEFVTTEEYQSDLEDSFEEASDEYQQFRNAQLATQLIVGTEENAIQTEVESRAEGALAFYSPSGEYMAFIDDDPSEMTVDQDTLAHELLHALEDQHFDLVETQEGITTTDEEGAVISVVEGTATHVDGTYLDNCEAGEWADSCVLDESDGGAGEPPNWGLYIKQFAPYTTPLVAETHEQDGWEGVNELYEELPDSTVEAIYPDRYGEFEVEDIAVPDESDGDWERISVDEQERQVVGQHGVVATLAAPVYESNGQVQPMDVEAFLRGSAGGVLNYDVPEAAGWTADGMYGYTDGDEFGSVWKLAWETEEDAATFADSYQQVVEFRGGESHEEYDGVYVFDTDEYQMSLHLQQDGDRVWIVAAPTVDDLTAIHDVELEEADDEQTPDEDETPTPDDGDDQDGAADGDNGTTDDQDGATDGDDETPDGGDDTDADGAGFSVVAGVVAVLLATLLLRRRA